MSPLVNASAYPIPSYVSTEEAYTSVTIVPGTVVGKNYIYNITGDAWETLTSIFFRLNTNATATARDPLIRIRDQDGNGIERVYSFLPQTGSQVIDHAFDSTVGAGYSPEPSVARTPLIGYPLQSGWSLEIGANNMQAGDVISLLSIITTKYPTDAEPKTIPLVSSPLLT